MTSPGAAVAADKIFVDGAWIDSAGTETISIVNPVTEEAIAEVARGTAADVDAATSAAVAAFGDWSRSAVADRAALLKRMARLVEERTEELTETIVTELGYPLAAARASQVAGAVEELDLMAGFVSEILWSEDVGGAEIRREPAGVVGAITAWNAPLRSVISKAGAAIAAGCTVVLKPSEVAPLSAYAFAEIAQEAGLPDGVFNLVSGTGPEVGEAISAHPDIDMVSLTGSVTAGRAVMRTAAEYVKRVHLELGGKSANVILEDADLEHALREGLKDSFRNTGQVCGGLTRVLVPRAALAQAKEIAADAAQSYVLGDPFDPRTTLGPVANAAQRTRVRGYITQGIAQGVELVCGGAEPPEGIERGYFVRPTVFAGDNDSVIAREEIFGPVVVLIPFDTEQDAIAIANDSAYGLAGAVWSADDDRARAVARQLRVGRVRINGAPLNKRAVHGGFKLSGIGREWGRVGIEEFLEYQSLMG